MGRFNKATTENIQIKYFLIFQCEVFIGASKYVSLKLLLLEKNISSKKSEHYNYYDSKSSFIISSDLLLKSFYLKQSGTFKII